jgi:cell division septation protein DedD
VLYRVRVGPVKSRAEAESLARRIAAEARLDARPVPHP